VPREPGTCAVYVRMCVLRACVSQPTGERAHWGAAAAEENM
jgi:hypothetical protein